MIKDITPQERKAKDQEINGLADTCESWLNTIACVRTGATNMCDLYANAFDFYLRYKTRDAGAIKPWALVITLDASAEEPFYNAISDNLSVFQNSKIVKDYLEAKMDESRFLLMFTWHTKDIVLSFVKYHKPWYLMERAQCTDEHSARVMAFLLKYPHVLICCAKGILCNDLEP